MAIFHAAADESDGPTQRGPFLYGGFVAPVPYWVDVFAPAWEKRVLNGPPVIPFLHMVDIRSKAWRAKRGLTDDQAEWRVEAATHTIGEMKGLHPVKSQMDGGHFRDAFKPFKIVRRGKQLGAYALEPDYIGFLGFAYAALERVAQAHPDAERVDFVVERKGKITHYIHDFHSNLEGSLREAGRCDLMHLIGEVIPGGKECVPLQAADVALWHLRRYEVRDCNHTDIRRLQMMFDSREMMVNGLTAEGIIHMESRYKANSVPSPFQRKRGG